jgi:hypothetical protein
MKLAEELLRMDSKKQKDKIVGYVGNDPKKFAHLIDIFLQGPYRITQRAAWPVSYCIQQHPHLLAPHLKKILTFAGRPDIPDAVKRNTMRLLQFVRVPKTHQGATADLCFKFLTNTKEPIAVRVFAMTVLANLAKEIPELKNELILIIESQLPYASAAFLSRSGKVLKELKK